MVSRNVQPVMRCATSLILLALAVTSHAQSTEPTPPKGEVLIQSHGEPPEEVTAPAAVQTTAPIKSGGSIPPVEGASDITDAERSALTFTAYDLDARLTPATSHLAMRARLTVRNDGSAPLAHIALQVSSALHWETATLLPSLTHLAFEQHLLDSDVDHTGKVSEAVVRLPEPLAPGASITLDTFYSGAIVPSSTRLERLGAPHDQASTADWDGMTSDNVSLRGFGDVLWYPASSPQAFLGDGAQLFDAIGQAKLREAVATTHLRLTVDYAGDPPLAAYFCGRRAPFTALSDNADAPIAMSPGVATAEFAAAPLGFRVMSLFLTALPETMAAPLPGSSNSQQMLAVYAMNETAIPLVAGHAKEAASLLAEWLGPQPLSALAVIDHPGQPFEDGPLLVAPLAALGAADAAPALTHSLTHAWVQTGQPWIDEGLAQFFVLLAAERHEGREAATGQLQTLLQPLALVEPAFEAGKPAPVGQPLIASAAEVYYRRKAAAVWWMLRDVAGEEPLKLTLQAFRTQPVLAETPDQQARAFEALLEKNAALDLSWFFNDWVFNDRGLPDLVIVDVTPRELPAATGKSSGWLVSVTVRNEGGAVADVPLIIRSGTYSTTQRMRIAAFSTVSTRIVVEAAPTQMLLNDGSIPEQRTSTHTREIVNRTKQ